LLDRAPRPGGDLMGRLAGKCAFISGAASGLGLAMARAFVAEGAKVAIGDIQEEQGRRAADDIGKAAVFFTHDVTEEQHWIDNLRRAAEALGKIDTVVNNAGIGTFGNIEKATLEQFRRVQAVNVEGVFLGCKYGLAHIRHAGGGAIINISSIAGIIGDPSLAAYCASKGAVRLLTKSVALHCAKKRYGVRCNSIHPVFTQTPMVDAFITAAADPDRMRAGLEAAVPMGRLGQPEEIAAMAVYLASEEAKFVTGAEFVIDGGLTAA
jgi:3(or 17)beta-hydroxysteroid dehydrogenase